MIASDLGELPPDLDGLVLMQAAAALGYNFKIGKYPVTNYQYRHFLEAGGYDNERWWSKEGLRYKQQSNRTEPYWWDDTSFNRITQPVVGISWVEAEANCKWLTARWRGAGLIGQQERVRLPTQEEWMVAARSSRPAPDNGALDHPWHGPFDPAFANTKESDLQQTSPVHLYPQGVTADGVWDMAGNVWEWTNDVDEQGRFRTKGGCWADDKEQAKASAAVVWLIRLDWNALIGCRVVVVLISR